MQRFRRGRIEQCSGALASLRIAFIFVLEFQLRSRHAGSDPGRLGVQSTKEINLSSGIVGWKLENSVFLKSFFYFFCFSLYRVFKNYYQYKYSPARVRISRNRRGARYATRTQYARVYTGNDKHNNTCSQYGR
ncbi:hypothetical protein PUN28_009280 [Cardiocondyla obscurior]|uniref:Secreted protein n=1 Tax=Cardiocondyla obscurior TaxID=286306 RepID=A0AAW2FRQ9_9HYME